MYILVNSSSDAVRTPTIIKDPNKIDYVLGLDNRIDLTCSTDGNPKSSYLWYKNNQFAAISTSNTFSIEGVTKRNEGIYTQNVFIFILVY